MGFRLRARLPRSILKGIMMHKILFMGRKPVASQALEWLCERDDVKVVGVITDSHLSTSPTRDIALKFGIDIMNREDVEKRIRDGLLNFDLGVSMLYWQKIRSVVINSAKKGVINFHPAPLPEFKGTAGYNLAILENHKSWAVTAHYVDEGFDTGATIELSWFDVDQEQETAQSLEKKAQPELLNQFKRIISRVLDSDDLLPTVPNKGGRYISRAEMESMKALTPEDDVARKIRAFWFPPYDGAFMMVGGVKCTLVHGPILKTLSDPSVSNLFTSPSE